MPVEVGSAVGYLDLDISGYMAGISTATAAQEGFKNKSTSVTKALGTVGKGCTKVGTAMTKYVSVPITAAGAASIKTAADFESSMSKVAAVSGTAADAVIELADGSVTTLSKKAQEMGATTKFSASEAADALYYMGLAGWNSGQMVEGLDGVMNLAAASGEDLATTSDIVTDALTAFGLKAKDSTHFADILAKTSSASNTNVSLLGETFKYVAPLCGAMGYSAEDASVAIGLMANAGIKGSQAGTALKTALANLAKPTDQQAAMMEKLGISITNSDGSMKSLDEVMGNVRASMKGLSKDQQAAAASTLFGKEAMSGMLAVVNTSEEDYNNLKEAIYNCDGTAKNMADTMNDNLKGQLTIIKSSLEGLAISIGNILMPAIKNFATNLQKLLNWLNSLSKEQQTVIVMIAKVIAVIGPLLVVVGKIMTSVSKMPTIIAGASKAFSVLGKVIAGVAGPILAIVAVITTLTVAFKYLWDTNEQFRNSIIAIWENIKTKIEDFCNGIVERLNGLGFEFESITEVLFAIWNGFCQILAPIFEGVFNQIGVILGTALDVLTGLFDIFTGLFTLNWNKVWQGVQEVFGGVWDGILGTFETWGNAIKGILDTVMGWFGIDFGDCMNNTSSVFSNVWQGICDFFISIWTTIRDFFTSVYDYLVETLGPLFTAIGESFRLLWEDIQLIWSYVEPYFAGIWEAIKAIFSVVVEFFKLVFTAAWEGIKLVWSVAVKFFSLVWEGIKTVFSVVVDVLGSFFKGAWDVIVAVWEVAVNFFALIWNGIRLVFAVVKGVLSGDFGDAWEAIKAIWNAAGKFFESVWNLIKTIFSSVGNFFGSIFRGAYDIVTGIFNNLVSFFGGVWDRIKNTFSALGTAIGNAISGAVKSGINGVISMIEGTVNTAVNLINGAINLINKIPGVSIGKLDKLSLPRLATGGITKGATLAEIGEDGREAVIPLEKNLGWIKVFVSEFISRLQEVWNIRNMFEETFGEMLSTLNEIASLLRNLNTNFGTGLNTIVFGKERPVRGTDDVKQQRMAGGIAGNNFNFYSNARLSEIESAKEMKKAIRELEEEFA